MRHTPAFRPLLILVFIVGISLLHYTTPLYLPMLHDIFQRLYYIPVILAAFWFGLRGGLIAALCVSLAYVPHIMFQWGGHVSMELDKYLEIVMYNVVGGVTGLLAGREQRRRAQLEKTARGLEASYAKLEEQSERIIAIEEQLRRAERLSLMGELSAVLAHEIRNPLGSIRGTAEILKDDFAPGDRKYEFVEILVKETERLNRVVEEFLRQARPQPGTRERFDLAEELRMVATLVAAEAKRRGITLDMQVAAVELSGDRDQLRQVVLNLLLNALHATPAEGRVTLAVNENGAMIELQVTDTGSGIPPADLPRLFEPFFTTKEEGTGLGLAVAKRIVTAHGGTISVQSEEGEGTTVTLRLPAIGTEDTDER